MVTMHDVLDAQWVLDNHKDGMLSKVKRKCQQSSPVVYDCKQKRKCRDEGRNLHEFDGCGWRLDGEAGLLLFVALLDRHFACLHAHKQPRASLLVLLHCTSADILSALCLMAEALVTAASAADGPQCSVHGQCGNWHLSALFSHCLSAW